MRSPAIWKLGTIVGVGLTTIGVGAGYFDEATNFRFPFVSDYFGMFLLGLLVGFVMSFVSIIGWARLLGSKGRSRTAMIVFISPWLAGFLGYPIERFNVHGPSALLWFLVMPAASILALVLRIMAG
jgi:hypothetical protein